MGDHYLSFRAEVKVEIEVKAWAEKFNATTQVAKSNIVS